MARPDTAWFYYYWVFYWHSKVWVEPIPPEPDPSEPVDPCDLCPPGYNCVNGECVKPPEPGWGWWETINPQIIDPDNPPEEDIPANEATECVLLRDINNGIVQSENGYITWADATSWWRYRISRECYSWVIMEWKLTDATNPNNVLWFWSDHDLHSFSLPSRSDIDWNTRVRISIDAETWDYQIDTRKKINNTTRTDWITYEIWNINTWVTLDTDWMVVWVLWGAVIFTTMARETSWLVPVSVDALPDALPSSASWTYPLSNVNVWWTTKNSDWNTVRTKRFFTFIDWEDYYNWKLTYEWWILRVLPWVYSDLWVPIWNEPFPKTNNTVCSTYTDIVFKSRYPQYENHFGISVWVDIIIWTWPVYEHDWAYLAGVNCPDWWQFVFNETSYNIDSTKEYRLFCEFSRWEYDNDFNAYFYVGNYATDTWTLLDSISTSYYSTAYDDYWDTVFGWLTMRAETFDSSETDWWVDIIYASNGHENCSNQVLVEDTNPWGN